MRQPNHRPHHPHANQRKRDEELVEAMRRIRGVNARRLIKRAARTRKFALRKYYLPPVRRRQLPVLYEAQPDCLRNSPYAGEGDRPVS